MTDTITALAFEVDSKAFATACAVAARRVPQKPEPPVLGGTLLEVADGRLRVSAFDYNVSSTSVLEVTGARDGRCLVSGRLLGELAKTLPAKPVTATLGTGSLALTCGTVRLSLPTMTVEDYPTLPVLPDPIGTVDATVFAEAIERVAPAADLTGAAAAPSLTGVYLTFGPSDIGLIGTNRYRGAALSIGWTPGGPNTEASALVPAAVLLDLARLVDAPETLTITHGSGTVGFSLMRCALICRQLDAGSFPTNMPAQMPPRADEPVTIAVGPLTAAVKRAAMVLEPSAAVKLAFTPGQVAVGGTGTADVEEPLECDATETAQVGLRPSYLLDALSMVHADKVEISLPASKRRPMVLSVPGDASYRHFIMPIAQG